MDTAPWLAPVRRRSMAITTALGLPVVLALAALAARVGNIPAGIAMLAISLIILGLVVRWRSSRYDHRWLVHKLDASRPDIEDSAALLFADRTALSPLERLQRQRLEARIDDQSASSLAPPWPTKPIATFAALCALIILVAIFWPNADRSRPTLSPSDERIAATPGRPRLTAQNMRIIPPPYTALPMRDAASLDARVPAGSRIEWTLQFTPQPNAPRLALLNGRPLSLRREGDLWIASAIANKSFLYRVDATAGKGATPPLHRIDATPDALPQVKAISPKDSLTMVSSAQKSWTPIFSATDDYGVAATARLRVTLAIGEGENITFTEREIAVTGTGPQRDRRFAPQLDFSRFSFAAGGDMVVQLIVHDNRVPNPQDVRGPSLILRWPGAKPPESSGLTGMVNTTLPAYFRSQRQIIIDAEALLKQRRALTADRFLSRSAAIGGDQQILRGRYSQFLGGEQEGEPELPTADADGHSDGDGHDHGGPPKAAPSVFGEKEDVLAEFGHPHDESPASSLAPETRAILKQAVDEMWQSERELKTGHPDRALPYANRALRFIKEVQQATRIFLSRVGPELPPIDPSRRMTGKRDGIASRDLSLDALAAQDAPAAAIWSALGDPARTIDNNALAALDRWTRANADRLPDALALGGAIDAVSREPDCVGCKMRLRALLWAAMERPAAKPIRRLPADQTGRRYLGSIGSPR